MNPNKVIAILCLLAALWLNLSPDNMLPGEPSSPVPGSGLHVLIIEDRVNRQKLPPEQLDAMMSSDVDELIRGAGGHKYLYDQNQDVSTKDDPWVKAAMQVKRDSLPWLVIDKDGKGSSEAFSKQPSEFKSLVNSYLGK